MFGVADARVAASVRAYVKLLRAARAILARVEPPLAAQGLTITQLGVLEALLHLGPASQRELRTKVLTSAGNMTDVVDKLVARGLVRRARDARDLRRVRIELTGAGQAMIEGIFPGHAAEIGRAMAGLDGAELGQLDALLRKLGRAASGGA
jgi:MarR family 2-MHQ and catechol resistance regulon transcriptional repressor